MSDEQLKSERETWLFCGTRLGDNDKRQHAWLPLPATDLKGVLRYAPGKGEHYAVGSVYEVRVERKDGMVSMYQAAPDGADSVSRVRDPARHQTVVS